MDDFPAPPNPSQPKTPWFDPVCAILMGVASLSTAWCSYQNSRWSGVSGDLATHADKLDRHASMQHLEAGQFQEEQMLLWADAESNKAGHHAGNYLSNTVILAMVVFFAGTSGKFDQRRVRWSSLTFALALFAFVAVRMCMHPIQ